MDVDRSGDLNFDEFLNLIAHHTQEEQAINAIYEAFEAFDEEGLGIIPANELRHVLTNLGEKLTDVEIDELLKQADAKKDGRIRYKDFVSNMEGKKKKGKKKVEKDRK